jgi:putative oxidoreductase
MSLRFMPAARAWIGDKKRAERFAIVFLRLALGTAFLSGIASRFGWYGKDAGYGNFANFVKYTAEVNSFMPASTIPFLAWAATIAELGLGVALVLGLWPRIAAFGSALLLALFGTAMAISFGIRSPLDYSVFSACAGALLLGIRESGEELPAPTGSTRE